MSVQFTIPSGAITLVAATAKTAIELSMGANIPGEIIALDVSSSYLTAGTPIDLLVELGTITATGTGTAATPKRIGSAQGTALDTAKTNDTVEPSGFSQVEAWDLVLPTGPFPYQWPLGREFYLAISTLYAVRLTASAACTVRANFVYEV